MVKMNECKNAEDEISIKFKTQADYTFCCFHIPTVSGEMLFTTPDYIFILFSVLGNDNICQNNCS